MNAQESVDYERVAVNLAGQLFEKVNLPQRGIYEIAQKTERTEDEQRIWDGFLKFLRTTDESGRSIIESFKAYVEEAKGSPVAKYAADQKHGKTLKRIRVYVDGLTRQLKDAGYKKKGWF